MNKVLNLTYASSLTHLCEINSSFDSGILRIAYTGTNRNGSYIDRQTFENCLKTIYNCPIVCHYDRDSDTLGGHDIEVVSDNDGGLRVINLTTPIGCIPESSKVFWEMVEEDDGSVHEYLCAEALLWKRQEAYQKIKKDGLSAQSMEITVNSGEFVNGIYKIYDFEFTAFALIGEEPCFESAAFEFSKQNFKQQLSQMMLEIKECFSAVSTSSEDDIYQQKSSTEGGKKVLNEKINLIAKYNIDADKLGFSIEDISLEELEEKLKSFKDTSKNDSSTKPTDNDSKDGKDKKFALEGNLRDELVRVLDTVTVQREWGEYPRYGFVDYDKDTGLVYCWDTEDWLLYGFPYKVDGDSVTIDYACKKRKKYEIVDFDEGEQSCPLEQVFEVLEDKIKTNAEFEAKYQNASNTIASMESELTTLRKFKSDTEEAVVQNKKDEIFARFEDLVGIEAFNALKENCADIDTDTLEEKCFAIRGRNSVVKLSETSKSPKLKVEKSDTAKVPYGGLFEQYGVTANK